MAADAPVAVELSPQLQKKHDHLFACRSDLEKSKSYIDYILKKRLHDGHVRNKGAYFQSEAFTTVLVVSYARAFTDPKEWHQELLAMVSPTSEELSLHRSIIRARNQLFAHSDKRHYKNTPAKLDGMRWELIEVSSFELEHEQLLNMRRLVLRLHDAVNLRMANIADGFTA